MPVLFLSRLCLCLLFVLFCFLSIPYLYCRDDYFIHGNLPASASCVVGWFISKSLSSGSVVIYVTGSHCFSHE